MIIPLMSLPWYNLSDGSAEAAMADLTIIPSKIILLMANQLATSPAYKLISTSTSKLSPENNKRAFLLSRIEKEK